MSEIALAKINSFGIPPKANFESPSEEAVFILTTGQLHEIISQAVEKAIQPLQDEVSQLRATVDRLEKKTASLETTQEHDVNRICLDIAYDRQRLARLERPTKKEPGKTEISRADKIEKYLTSRPDHRATFETLKGHLGIDKVLLNQTVKILMASSPGRYGIARTPDDKRKRTLVMLPK